MAVFPRMRSACKSSRVFPATIALALCITSHASFGQDAVQFNSEDTVLKGEIFYVPDIRQVAAVVLVGFTNAWTLGVRRYG